MRIKNPLAGLPREISVLVVIAFLVALGFGIVAPSIPIFARDFGVTKFEATAVISVFAFMRFISALGVGRLVDLIGERIVLTAGVWIVAISSVLAGLSRSYDQLLVLRGVGGVGSAMFTVSALGLLLRTAGEAQRGRASGAFQGGFLLGGVSGPFIGGFISEFSIRAPFFIYAGMLTIAGIFSMTALASSAAARRDRSPEAKAKAVDAEEHGFAPLWRALHNRSFVTAMFINLGNGFTAFGLRAALVPLFVVESLQRGPLLAGIGFFISAGVQGALLIPAGRISDQRGRKPALIMGTAGVTSGMIVLAFSSTPWLFLVGMGVLGVGSAFMGSAPAAVVGDVAGARGGTVVAAFQMASDLGSISGPLVAGALADTAGFPLAFATGAAVSGVGLALALTMRETRRLSPAVAGSSATTA